jgi:hypothetical protein
MHHVPTDTSPFTANTKNNIKSLQIYNPVISPASFHHSYTLGTEMSMLQLPILMAILNIVSENSIDHTKEHTHII